MAEYINTESAYDIDTLDDWYINSVMPNDTPVWTEEHLEELLNDFYVIPKDTPTTNVVSEKHGQWVYDHWCEFKCSECGEYSNSKPYKGKEKYCPNCGAKMDGDKI